MVKKYIGVQYLTKEDAEQIADMYHNTLIRYAEIRKMPYTDLYEILFDRDEIGNIEVD